MYGYDERRDGRNPYGSEGGYVMSSRGRGRGRSRGRRGDRGMDYGRDGRTIRSYPTIHPQGDCRGYDMRGRMDYGDMRNDYRNDGHYPQSHGNGYEPVEFMGYCNGYYGTPDHGRYPMHDRDDYRWNRRELGHERYDDYGDYGETLTQRELDEWEHKLMSHLDDREKQMFNKDVIMQKVRQLGKPMENFGEKELVVATLMAYTDYKDTIGQNIDMAVKLAYDWLADKDVAVKGAEKLAVYYDCIVEGD